MAVVISTLNDFIQLLNTLYNSSSTEPTSGEEDYTVWTDLANIAISIWENEEGLLWNELFVKLADAATGDKTTSANDYSYVVPTDFRAPASGYVWIGSSTSKVAFKVLKQNELQLHENDTENWCYFLMDGSPTLEFNPNITMTGGYTISYTYYKNASKLTTGTSTFEMSDPMFAVYFALAELKKEEGNAYEVQIMQQKLEAMKTRNIQPAWYQEDSLVNKTEAGFGY